MLNTPFDPPILPIPITPIPSTFFVSKEFVTKLKDEHAAEKTKLKDEHATEKTKMQQVCKCRLCRHSSAPNQSSSIIFHHLSSSSICSSL